MSKFNTPGWRNRAKDVRQKWLESRTVKSLICLVSGTVNNARRYHSKRFHSRIPICVDFHLIISHFINSHEVKAYHDRKEFHATHNKE